MSHLYPGKQVSKPHLLKHRQFASPIFKESMSQPLHRMFWVWWISKHTLGDFFQKKFSKSQNYRMVCIRNNFKDHLIPTPINIYIYIYSHTHTHILLYKAWISLKVRIREWLFSQSTFISRYLSPEIYTRLSFYLVQTFWIYLTDRRCYTTCLSPYLYFISCHYDEQRL